MAKTEGTSPEAAVVRRNPLALYKPGQGFWTRLGTAIGAGLVLLLFTKFLFDRFAGTEAFRDDKGQLILLLVGVFLVVGLLVYYFVNRPRPTDFLIATDSEMKKVSWSSWAEIIGSTKVVIVFMFFIALFLFIADLIFGYLFFFMGVLKLEPF
ncbi:MAG: preprotein translocase subunit SecE [Phycisphaerae bacterium]